MGIKSSKSAQTTKESSSNENAFKYPEPRQTPHHKRMFGGRGTAVSMAVGKLDPDLQDYLMESPLFNCKTEEEFVGVGFRKCVDYPDLVDHIYYEGYFHSQRDGKAVVSINPRDGTTFEKPSAPKSIRAFYVAFREGNAEGLQKISDSIRALDVDSLMPINDSVHPATAEKMSEEELKEFKERREKQDRAEIERNRNAVIVIADLFDQRKDGKCLELVLSDLAVQVHYGQEVDFEHIGWHYDAINSLFHLALSVHGSRDLYSLASDQPAEKEKECPLNVDKLAIGDVYVSSPYLFRHAVSYPKRDWKERTIAVQARFLLTPEIQKSIYGLSQEVKSAVATCVSDVIEGGFKYPTLEEVKSIESALN